MPGLRVPFLLLFGQAAAGVLLGVGWWALTRHPPAWLVGEPVVTSAGSSAVARDGTLAVLGTLVGVVVGFLVVAAARTRPLAVLGAGVAGALAGGLVAAGTGPLLPPSAPADPGHVSVTAWGVVLLWPLAVSAVVTLTALAGALRDWTAAPR